LPWNLATTHPLGQQSPYSVFATSTAAHTHRPPRRRPTQIARSPTTTTTPS